MKWTTGKLREEYLSYFESKGHERKDGAGLVPSDSSMLFTSAGMVQFKDIFWGRAEPANRRVTTCQRCFRATDIDRVGKTWYHHTFFEMLGNFSFGDYFKRGAIEMAWEFVTEVLGLPEEKLWVSIYKEDDRAYGVWRDEIGVPERKIVRLGKEENWWGPVGGSGPCGPDSEVFYDVGPEYGCGDDCRGVACDCNRFNEIWNLVFTGYEMDEEGRLTELEDQNIDTGMGLERTAAILQGVNSDFAIDIFRPLVEAEKEKFGLDEVSEDEKEHLFRIADHVRGAAFLVSEGIIPSNEGRGYVLRRVIRNAVHSGEALGYGAPFLTSFLDQVEETMADAYPEISERRKLIEEVLGSEEKNFRSTLKKGEEVFYELKGKIKEEDEGDVLAGKSAFRLYDTHGLPLEVIKELAEEHDLEVDMEGFEKELEKQKERARKESDLSNSESELSFLPEEETTFVGYREDSARSLITHLIEDGEPVEELKEGQQGLLVLEETPFYAESGGQVSDTGTVEIEGEGKACVTSVEKRSGVYLHELEVLFGRLRVEEECMASIDAERRRAIERNHTATHLVHRALKEVLGPHIVQSGSKVGPGELRFDFNHFTTLSLEEKREVEDVVCRKILEDRPVRISFTSSVEEAKEAGAVAHFEEEYKNQEEIRTVSVEGYTKELCGGTHVNRTGEIGGLKIVSSGTVAAGIRRIRAVTGTELLEAFRRRVDTLEELAEITGSGRKDLVSRVESIIDEKDRMEKKWEETSGKLLSSLKERLKEEKKTLKKGELVVAEPPVSSSQLRRLADILEGELSGVVILGAGEDGTASLVCKVSSEVAELVSAQKLMEEMVPIIGGGGGGNETFAQGGGPKRESLFEALEAGSNLAEEAMSG